MHSGFGTWTCANSSRKTNKRWRRSRFCLFFHVRPGPCFTCPGLCLQTNRFSFFDARPEKLRPARNRDLVTCAVQNMDLVTWSVGQLVSFSLCRCCCGVPPDGTPSANILNRGPLLCARLTRPCSLPRDQFDRKTGLPPPSTFAGGSATPRRCCLLFSFWRTA